MNASGGKIKILHIIKTLDLGGAETNLLNLVNAADRQKYEIHVAYSYGGEIESRFRQAQVQLFKYAQKNHRVRSLASIAIVARLARYILKNEIQIIHTHNFSAHLWGLAAGKLCGRKIVEHVHDFRYLERNEFRARRGENRQYGYAKYIRKMSDLVLVLTRQNYEFLTSHSLYPAKAVREIKNGIPLTAPFSLDEQAAGELKKKLGISDKSFVILTSARISSEKNIDLILRIAPEVTQRVPGTVFLVSGSGPLLGLYRYRAARLGLEQSVRVIGFNDVYPLLAISDVFLLPSFLELHSIAVLEAMSMHVPVVISKDVGCNSEFVKNWENGVLVDPFKKEGWGESIVRLLKIPSLRKKIGETGYRTCLEMFDIRRIAREIEGFYAELVVQ